MDYAGDLTQDTLGTRVLYDRAAMRIEYADVADVNGTTRSATCRAIGASLTQPDGRAR